jgi:signal transduction histidine kinase
VRNPWRAAALFGVCLAVVLAAMAWLSAELVALDRAERRAREDAAMEEAVRLALWRMDSALTPIIAEHSARPAYVYDTFYDPVFNTAATPATGGVPSPLLTAPSRFVLLDFVSSPAGTFGSPQVPLDPDSLRELQGLVSEGQLSIWSERLAQLQEAVEPSQVAMALLDAETSGGDALADVIDAPNLQQKLNVQELTTRTVLSNSMVETQQMAVNYYNPPALHTTGTFRPVWVGDALLLVRGGASYHGAWLDWPTLRRWLLDSVADLLPDAELRPLSAGTPDPDGRRLAWLPAVLVPGDLAVPVEGSTSPVALTLIVAWLCVLVAATAVAGLLRGILSLSERRAAFVSAVTHEMRTPLTTFRMYSEMLAEGMVDEERRGLYLETLQREADRLGHLVENVLAYARLEQGRGASSIGDVTVGDTLDRAVIRLADRARQSEMTLVVEGDEAHHAVSVRADAARVDQILLNLVDNACKYGASADDPTVRLSITRRGGWISMAVADQGPGVPTEVRRRLFQPFSRSAEEAAGSAPGVGLGLSLSRRLARDMGGDLRLLDGPGATFELTLRVP